MDKNQVSVKAKGYLVVEGEILTAIHVPEQGQAKGVAVDAAKVKEEKNNGKKNKARIYAKISQGTEKD